MFYLFDGNYCRYMGYLHIKSCSMNIRRDILLFAALADIKYLSKAGTLLLGCVLLPGFVWYIL